MKRGFKSSVKKFRHGHGLFLLVFLVVKKGEIMAFFLIFLFSVSPGAGSLSFSNLQIQTALATGGTMLPRRASRGAATII